MKVILATDYGVQGPYVGQMRLVLSAAQVQVIDLMADLPAFRPDLACYLLPPLLTPCPAPYVLIAVVDPGVGSARGALLVDAGTAVWIGPDNGLLTRLASRSPAPCQCYRVSWRPARMSSTFHGRDLFAPIAMRWLSGESLDLQPVDFQELVGQDWPEDSRRIVYQDHFGNLLLGIRAAALAGTRGLSHRGQWIPKASHFAEVPVGQLFWYENSLGLAELAVNQGSAAATLGLGVGDALG